jgi:hypothetical protein
MQARLKTRCGCTRYVNLHMDKGEFRPPSTYSVPLPVKMATKWTRASTEPVAVETRTFVLREVDSIDGEPTAFYEEQV